MTGAPTTADAIIVAPSLRWRSTEFALGWAEMTGLLLADVEARFAFERVRRARVNALGGSA